MTENDVRDLILAVLVEHELIPAPDSPQGRANALSREWHREQRAKREADFQAETEWLRMEGLRVCPPGDYCSACASRWCRCAEIDAKRAAREAQTQTQTQTPTSTP